MWSEYKLYALYGLPHVDIYSTFSEYSGLFMVCLCALSSDSSGITLRQLPRPLELTFEAKLLLFLHCGFCQASCYILMYLHRCYKGKYHNSRAICWSCTTVTVFCSVSRIAAIAIVMALHLFWVLTLTTSTTPSFEIFFSWEDSVWRAICIAMRMCNVYIVPVSKPIFT